MNARPAGRWKPVAIAALAALAVAGLGGAMTDLSDWYRALAKPAWQPPDWAFGPAWTLIFGLSAAAGVLGWRYAPDARGRRQLLAMFAANGGLNVLWSALFFHLRRPDWALAEVVLLWLSVLFLMVRLRPWSARAAALLLPYAAWVAFAAVLNLAIVRLNAPFA
ncbi:MAG: tryptophan-rich sensory protein [Methyloversatilis sp.]|jgi:benzodiazapine receptor|nr:tryptophan-rich sensory protein [Methyloversatilis sp.]